jgi:uncharacterized protein (TIGR02186 family)
MRIGLPFAKLLAALCLLGLAGSQVRAADPLVADLSKHLVAITTGFAGTDVLLFGAIEEVTGGKPGDVAVVVRGPNRTETVRHKERTAGIWINSGTAKADNAPSFYLAAATRPLDELAAPAVLARHQIGLDNLDLDIRVKDGGTGREEYRRALIRLNQKKGLYGARVLEIGMLSQRLFRTDVHFPANVPVGVYLVEVYLFVDGQVVSAQTTPLVVSKIGIGADIYDFAHHRAAVYGIIAVLLAAFAGWLAAAVFKKA